MPFTNEQFKKSYEKDSEFKNTIDAMSTDELNEFLSQNLVKGVGSDKGNQPTVKERVGMFARAGLPAAISGEPTTLPSVTRAVAPALGQTLGEFAAAPLTLTPLGTPSRVAAATAGNVIGTALNEAEDLISGKGFDFGELGKAAGTTAAVESAFQFPGAAVFGKLRIEKAREIAKGVLQNIKPKIDEFVKFHPEFSQSASSVRNELNRIFSKVPVKGSQHKVIQSYIDKVEESKGGFGFAELDQLREKVGEMSSFGTDKLSRSLDSYNKKSLRKFGEFLRSKTHELANQAGVGKQYNKATRIFSIASKKLGGKQAGFIHDLAIPSGIGGVLGTATANPLVGTSAFLTAATLRNPNVQKALYNALEKTGLGRAATLGTTAGIEQYGGNE